MFREHFVVPLGLGAELLLKPDGILQVDAADSGAVHLVGISRTDAAFGGSDLPGSGIGFLERVGAFVVFEDELGAVRQADVVDRESFCRNSFHLLDESEDIDDKTVADDVDHVRPEDAGGDEVKHIMFIADLDGVTRIVAALETDDHVDVAGEHVDEFALSFIAPLGSDQNVNRHIFPPDSRC